jgi:hypothetical protein
METLEQTIQRANEVGTQASAVTGVAFKPLTSTIDASKIAGSSPLKLTSPKPASRSAGLLASIEGLSINDQAQQNIAPLVDQKGIQSAQGVNDSLFSRIMDKLSGDKGQTALTNDAYQAEGVDTAKKELNDISSQINSKTLAYRRQIEKTRENSGGMFGGAVEQEVGRIERQAASELADLAVIQQAKNNNYATAREIADRKVAAQLETQQNELEALKFFYSDNKEKLNKKEDQQFQLLISERSRLLTEQADEKKAINNLALEALKAGAPASVAQRMMGAKSQMEALGMGGSYLRPQGGGAPTVKTINGVDMQWNPATQQWENIGTNGTNSAVVQPLQTKLDLVNSLVNNISKQNAVGPNKLARWSPVSLVTGGKGDFIAGVQQLTSQETMNALLNLKKAGGTLGALSEGESRMLKASASKIGTWAQTDSDGNITGYKTTEKAFKAELQRIQELTRKALEEAGVYQGISTDEQDEINSLMIGGASTPATFNAGNYF